MAPPLDARMQRAAGLFSAGRLDEARTAAESIVADDPRYFHALHLLAVLAARRGDFEACVDLSTRVAAIAPRNAEVLSNRGAALRKLDRIEEALASYERALALDPRHAMARFNRALSHLVTGDLARGWEDHEARWGGSDTQPPRRDFARRQWNGEPIEGKAVLVHAEQGLGDTLQFSRYVPLIIARGARVVLEVQPALKDLLERSFPQTTVIARGEALPAFDLHCPMLSLPLAFRTTLESIPADIPYVGVDEAHGAKWREKLGPARGRRIGLAWSGSAALANDRNRSIALAALQPLLEADAEFVSLQKEIREGDRDAMKAQPNLRHYGDDLADFRDTAALVSLVDLVVTVDTAVAHLAGAMGRESRVLLPFAPDWRWMLEREDTPWYPAMRLLRQPRRGDWTSAIDRVSREVHGLP